MASKKKDTSKVSEKGYQPKATARHARITKTKKEEIDSFKKRIETDKHLAKKYESGRKTEIRALPKEERAAAKAELKESIAQRKESEREDREKLRGMMHEEKTEKKNLRKEPFDEEAWLKGGRKKSKEAESPLAEKKSIADEGADGSEDTSVAEKETALLAQESSAEEPKNSENTADSPKPERTGNPKEKG